MLHYTYFIIAISFTALLAAIFYMRHELKAVYERKYLKTIDIKSLLNEASLGGYYYYDIKNDHHEFSANLLNMLGIKREIKNIEELTKLFGYDGKVLLKSINSLLNGKQVYFVMNCKAVLNDAEKYLQCSANRIDNYKGYAQGVVIWFYDVTEYISRLKRIAYENTRIKSELRESMMAMDAIPIPLWRRDRNADIKYCNISYSKILGNEESYMVGSSISELDKSLKKAIQRAVKNKEDFSIRDHIIVDGQRRYFQIYETPVADNDSYVGVAYDVNEIEEMEKELERHIAAHSDLLDSSSSAMAIFGRDMKLKFYNNPYKELWGFSEKWLDAMPSYAEVLENLRERRKLPEQADFRSFRKEQIGLFKNITSTHNEFFYLPDGKAIRVIVIPHALGGLLFAYEDITDRLAMERSYNTLIAVQKETLDNLSEGIMLVGEDGRVKLYNPRVIEIWPPLAAIVDKKPHISQTTEYLRELLPPDIDWAQFKDELIREITDRISSKTRIEKVDGMVIERTSVPLPDGATLISFLDITDSTLLERSLMERNEALIEADRLKTEFLASVSYELRTPLTSIMGFAEVLASGYGGELNNSQKEYIDAIVESSTGLLSLIDDILYLSSIEAGYVKLEVSKFNVYELLSLIVNMLRERCREKGLSIELRCQDKLGNIEADKNRIKQVIFNLISNSIKFTEPGGKITVGAEKSDSKMVAIWVEDTGIGILEEEKGKVFNNFFKSDSAYSMNKSGVGLGLSIVKNVIEMHNGRVEITSQKGMGTRVTCYLNKKMS